MSLKLIIRDHSFLCFIKGEKLVETKFISDQQCLEFIKALINEKKPASVDCLFAGKRIRSETKTFTAASKEELQDKISEETKQFPGYISHKIIENKVSGYPVAVVPADADNIESVIFFEAIDPSFRQALGKNMSLGSFAFSCAEKLYASHQNEEFIGLLVNDSDSDLFVKKKSTFAALSLPFGNESVIKIISEHLGVTPEIAASSLSLYSEKTIDPAQMQKMSEAISLFQTANDSQIKDTLTKLAEGISLPAAVHLVAEKQYAPFYDGFFKADSYHALCFTEKGFDVKNESEYDIIDA